MKFLQKITLCLVIFLTVNGCANYVKNSKEYKKVEKDIEIIKQTNRGFNSASYQADLKIEELKATRDLLKMQLDSLINAH